MGTFGVVIATIGVARLPMRDCSWACIRKTIIIMMMMMMIGGLTDTL